MIVPERGGCDSLLSFIVWSKLSPQVRSRVNVPTGIPYRLDTVNFSPIFLLLYSLATRSINYPGSFINHAGFAERLRYSRVQY